MKRFLNKRGKQATTALVLTAWMFAFASGIANACLLEQARGSHVQAHSHAAGIDASPHAHAHAATGPSEQVTDMPGDADQSPAAKALCLEACDDREHYLPKQNLTLDPPDLAPLIVVAVVWIASQSIASAAGVKPDKAADPFGIPIRLRYSRLTL